jgi:hypothetical protein
LTSDERIDHGGTFYCKNSAKKSDANFLASVRVGASVSWVLIKMVCFLGRRSPHQFRKRLQTRRHNFVFLYTNSDPYLFPLK